MTKITVPVPKLDEAIAKVLSSGSRGVEPRIAIRRDLCRTDNAGVPRFEPGQLPPANAFWSVTMYDEPNKLLVPNPIDRYLINSPMLPQLTKDKDGGLTPYLHCRPTRRTRTRSRTGYQCRRSKAGPRLYSLHRGVQD